jgi:tRNA threonylcarbamoyladenosine dehydratase
LKVATRADVGTPKVVAMKNHLLEILPSAKIEAYVELFNLQAAPRLLEGKPDFVLGIFSTDADCIDHLQTKAELIHYCLSNGIKIMSSMGAGAKADPSRIQVADISDTYEDALARATRRILKTLGCDAKVPVVYSTERPGDVKLLPLDESKVEEADQYSSLPTFRSRILPVLGTIPALFGNAMASYVVTELAGFPTEPLVVQNSRKVVERNYRDLVDSERATLGEE